ncbi:hypothetical protein BO82DRAFT_353201 [Aspergillus uvarum CBS 121591]|uniref:Secreted protein n=1 Tax=Aspergillus uvarum CBS 121591 TaxID=1448315 RepID=A0A319DUT1_9EURO|nr:hypothetical protein BO82DRAFT_353201 [Aspergillus uvarum CBS 121591]PYH82902.1 hypothetical protein BO82DRAFT_353201 [Aspergillus uvarum CBS 121591]
MSMVFLGIPRTSDLLLLLLLLLDLSRDSLPLSAFFLNPPSYSHLDFAEAGYFCVSVSVPTSQLVSGWWDALHVGNRSTLLRLFARIALKSTKVQSLSWILPPRISAS